MTTVLRALLATTSLIALVAAGSALARHVGDGQLPVRGATARLRRGGRRLLEDLDDLHDPRPRNR